MFQIWDKGGIDEINIDLVANDFIHYGIILNKDQFVQTLKQSKIYNEKETFTLKSLLHLVR